MYFEPEERGKEGSKVFGSEEREGGLLLIIGLGPMGGGNFSFYSLFIHTFSFAS